MYCDEQISAGQAMCHRLSGVFTCRLGSMPAGWDEYSAYTLPL